MTLFRVDALCFAVGLALSSLPGWCVRSGPPNFQSLDTIVEASKTKQKHDVTKPCTQCVFLPLTGQLEPRDRECAT